MALPVPLVLFTRITSPLPALIASKAKPAPVVVIITESDPPLVVNVFCAVIVCVVARVTKPVRSEVKATVPLASGKVYSRLDTELLKPRINPPLLWVVTKILLTELNPMTFVFEVVEEVPLVFLMIIGFAVPAAAT